LFLFFMLSFFFLPFLVLSFLFSSSPRSIFPSFMFFLSFLLVHLLRRFYPSCFPSFFVIFLTSLGASTWRNTCLWSCSCRGDFMFANGEAGGMSRSLLMDLDELRSPFLHSRCVA
jgi:hypothetical protein